MYAVSQIAIGLTIAHVAWLLFYLTGAMVVLPKPSDGLDAGRATLRLVIASASGFAIYGFESFAIGMVGLFSSIGLLLIAAANIALFLFLRRSGYVSQTFLVERRKEIGCAFRGPSAILYAFMLILSANAAIPDFQSDTLRVHLAYPYAWYLAGRIYVDHSFRFPYYTYNTELLYALMFVVHSGRYIPFLSWLAGTFACLGTYGLIASVDEGAQRGRSQLERAAASFVYIFLPVSVVFSAIFLRWTDTAMTDTITGMLLLGGTAGIALTALSGRSRYLLAGVLCFGFLAGVKPSFLFFVPFSALAILALSGRANRRRGLLLAAALCVLSAPWYVKNFVQTGDPVPPLVHFALGQSDPDFTRRDFDSLMSDLRPDRSLAAIETLPLREFRHTLSDDFREYGTTAVFLALYAILFAMPLLAFKREKSPSELALSYVLCTTALGFAYLIATSVLARYSLLIYPTLAASAGLLALYLARMVPHGMLAVPVFALLCIVPSRSSLPFYDNFDDVGYNAISAIMPNDRAALERQVQGYGAAEGIFDAPVFAQKAFPNVLLIGMDSNYYFLVHGERPFGDWVGSGRYSDFADAIDVGQVMAYLDAHRVGGIEIAMDADILAPDEFKYLEQQLKNGAFVKLSESDRYFSAFARSPQ